MAYYAKVVNGVVQQIIVAEPEFFQSFVDTSPGQWIETFPDGSSRKNYAGIGFSYDVTKDAFISQKPYPSWSLNEQTCKWEAPIPRPNDGLNYMWDEDQQAWIARS